MKKLVSVLILLCMLFSIIPVMAEEESFMNANTQEFTTETFEGEIVVPVTKTIKEWKKSTAAPNYDGGEHLYCNTSGAVMRYVFDQDEIKPGNYEVYYWVCPLFNGPEIVNFEIHHSGKISKASVLSKIGKEETLDPGWVSMGVYDFSGEGEEKGEAKCPGKVYYRATAMKLVPTDKEVTDKRSETMADLDLPTEIKDVPQGTCEWEGDWRFSTAVPGPMTDYYKSLWITSKTAGAYVNYWPRFETPCKVRISVYLLQYSIGSTSDVRYSVYRAGSVDKFSLNPSLLRESEWQTLGTFDFEGKPGEEHVQLTTNGNPADDTNTRASTVLFEVIGDSGEVEKRVFVTPIDGIATANVTTVVKLDKFSDMKNHWANYDVEYMANEGLVSGKGEGKFDPDAQITRAEYLTILDRAMGYELVTGETYADVPQDSWYSTYVATAKANGLLEGLPTDDGFKPETPITREDMALFTYNAIKATKKNDEWVAKLPTDFAKFTDVSEISDYAKQALEYLVQTGIIKGMTDTTVAPKGNATRAQGAVMLKRFMQYFVWAGPTTDEDWVMTFNDEFLGESVDWSVWQSQDKAASTLSSRWPENAVVKNGDVHLEIRKEDRGFMEWTAGNIWVRPDVFSQKYGYFEARYKIAAAEGINNAFWLWSSGVTDSRDYYCEIDVNEGAYPNQANLTYIYPTGETTRATERTTYRSEYDMSVDYHTYGLEWNENELIFYVDGKEEHRAQNRSAHLLLFPYLSSAVLGSRGEAKAEADGTAMVVDYVRVWQKKDLVNNPEFTRINKPIEGASPSNVMKVNIKDGVKTVTIKEQKVDSKNYKNETILLPTTSGNWKKSSTGVFEGGECLYSKDEGDTFTFDLTKVTPGKYKMYYWRTPHATGKEQIDLTLYQSGKFSYAGSVATKLEEGKTADSGWVLLGEFDLTGSVMNGEAYLSYINEGEGYTRVSGIKLVPVTE